MVLYDNSIHHIEHLDEVFTIDDYHVPRHVGFVVFAFTQIQHSVCKYFHHNVQGAMHWVVEVVEKLQGKDQKLRRQEDAILGVWNWRISSIGWKRDP